MISPNRPIRILKPYDVDEASAHSSCKNKTHIFRKLVSYCAIFACSLSY